MITLNIQDREGGAHTIETAPEGSLMEAIRNNGFTENFALCGGYCSCATCHVIIDDAFLGRVGTMSDDEDTLLDNAEDRAKGSRLSCQIKLEQDLDGVTVKIIGK